MNIQLKAKLLQHLSQKKENQGFTLIELLVVIIIIGILAAIALPSFLNQANKARASEAKTYVGSMNRAQQAYILENPDFVTEDDDFSKLGLGIQQETTYYTYGVDDVGPGVMNTATPTTDAGDPPILKAYTGTVGIGQTEAAGGAGTGEATSIAVLCETLNPVDDGFTHAEAAFNADETALECDDTVYKPIQ